MKIKSVLIITGICCGIGVLINILSLNYSSMERVYSNDSKIVSEYDSYGLDKKENRIEGNRYHGEFILSGSYTIWKYECDEDREIDIEWSFAATNGKAKLVLISPSNEITVLASNDEGNNNDTSNKMKVLLKKGTNRIKLVAKSKASIKFELQIDEGAFTK